MARHFFRLIIIPLAIVVTCILLTLYSLGTQASLSTQLSVHDLNGMPMTGTAATIAIHSRQGQGAVYQATYLPSVTDEQGNTASWIGHLNALFIDAIGNFREDGNGDGILQENDYAIDPAVTIFLDELDKTNKIARFKFKVTPNASRAFASEIKPISDLRTLWSAHRQLSGLSDVISQRTYSAKANTGRYIFTFLDFNGDGIVDNDETKDFVPDSFGSGSYGALNVQDADSASALVNYIRGDESQAASKGMRNRTLHTENGTAEVMRLGDIVNSTPTEVGAPAESFDLLYGDKSYAAFRAKYVQRRHMVYVGANDGMIHAFNAGFYNAKAQSYELHGSGTEVQHPLGSELWAYIPYNLLPHLHGLPSRKYRHAWYVDGKPRIFDARIFTADATHPGGWGTVMVVGMRFGGAPVALNADTKKAGLGAFTSAGAAIKTLTTHSAYVLMDITDPEQKPTLLAEITDPAGNMGFTTSYPTVAAFSDKNKAGQWYLILGSGPTLEKTATSTESAKLYVYDLIKKAFVRKGTNAYLFDLASQAPNSFVGDPVSADWNLNFKTDAVYFGTVGGSESSPEGKLFKLSFTADGTAGAETSQSNQWAAPVVLVDPNNPIVSAPSITKDELGYRWVSAGTGRLFSKGDQDSKQAQSLFAVIDALPATTPSYKELVDVSSAKVSTAGNVENVEGAKTQSELIQLIQAKKGWKRLLAHNSTGIAERNISATSLLGGTLFATAVTPCAGQCSDASSHLYCLHYKTGTANARLPACGISDELSVSPPRGITADVIDLGAGISASPSLHLDQDAHSSRHTLTVITQSTTGGVAHTRTQASAIVRSGEIDWREIRP